MSKAGHFSDGSGGAANATYARRVSRRRQRALVSIGTAACLVFAAVAPALLAPQREPPGYALSNSVVFYLEQCLATFLISYVVLAIVVRSVIGGELPSAISKEGLTWSDDVSAATREALETLQTQFEILERDVRQLAKQMVVCHESYTESDV